VSTLFIRSGAADFSFRCSCGNNRLITTSNGRSKSPLKTGQVWQFFQVPGEIFDALQDSSISPFPKIHGA
jgi:hypothetical protein